MANENPDFFDPVEDCPWRPPREIFARGGYSPVPPTQLDDRQLPGRLWELLYAAAAHRIFFSSTDHLSDRELYTMLWEQWLDEPTPDVPPEAETNTNIDISAFKAGGMTNNDIWERFYADEAEQAPPYDRDRFLPVAPIPLEAHSGWLPGDDDLPENAEPDPLGLAEIDGEIAETNNESNSDDGPPNPALEKRLRASEPKNWTAPAETLVEENIPLLPPAEITDETLTPILWELLHNLALRGFYVLNTDHLSDREVYGELWERGLREPAHLPGRNPRGGWYHDFLGGWGEEETQLWLRYYASEDQRAKHVEEWPKVPIPPKEKRPFNRDWRLPKGPF